MIGRRKKCHYRQGEYTQLEYNWQRHYDEVTPICRGTIAWQKSPNLQSNWLLEFLGILSVSIYGIFHSNEEVELKLLIAGALPFITFSFSLLKITICSERQQMGMCFMSCYLCCCLNGRITAVSTAVESDAWFLFQHMYLFSSPIKKECKSGHTFA